MSCFFPPKHSYTVWWWSPSFAGNSSVCTLTKPLNELDVHLCMWSNAAGTKVKINGLMYSECYQKRVGVQFVTTPLFQKELSQSASSSSSFTSFTSSSNSSVYRSRLHGLHLYLRLTCRSLPRPNLACLCGLNTPSPRIVICVEPWTDPGCWRAARWGECSRDRGKRGQEQPKGRSGSVSVGGSSTHTHEHLKTLLHTLNEVSTSINDLFQPLRFSFFYFLTVLFLWSLFGVFVSLNNFFSFHFLPPCLSSLPQSLLQTPPMPAWWQQLLYAPWCSSFWWPPSWPFSSLSGAGSSRVTGPTAAATSRRAFSAAARKRARTERAEVRGAAASRVATTTAPSTYTMRARPTRALERKTTTSRSPWGANLNMAPKHPPPKTSCWATNWTKPRGGSLTRWRRRRGMTTSLGEARSFSYARLTTRTIWLEITWMMTWSLSGTDRSSRELPSTSKVGQREIKEEEKEK